ncbi:DNA-binding transcriptional regulator, AcrR family [Pseudarcicella hirudinis]|uniref:DNA-binding transcriptional regulator, AcrR family n=1 Tax=Pseudarcicella hirudinis TaxID=1079859 RepID=A0A1I5YGH0_9BACT|nr:TetR/AcrR family transcriptional regulator [Pseudarcicella hirudinis]SFQ43309.1 DNA-binding transcriptional regulator, AcrR family [Pseudarcicella hirudinis]
MKFVPRSEKTRQFIIETTAKIFNMKGYAGTSMSDLTEATKLTKGSIYGNFQNKDEVALAVFNYNSEKRAEIIIGKLAGESTSTAKLIAFANLFGSAENTVFPEGGCPLLNTAVEADDTHEPLRIRVAEEFQGLQELISSVIKTGIEKGEFKKDTEPVKTAFSIIAMIEGGILLSRAFKNNFHLDVIVESVKELIKKISN